MNGPPTSALPETWEAYEESLDLPLRRNLRRRAEKLASDADDEISVRLVTTPEDVESTIETLALLCRGGRGLREAGNLQTSSLVEFHCRVAARFLENGRLRLHRIDIAGRPAAIVYCFRQGDTVSLYQAAYDPAFARYGPCLHLIGAAVAAAISEGAAEFDLLRGAEEHKNRWANVVRHDRQVLKPASTRGRMLLGLRAALRPLQTVGRGLRRRPRLRKSA